jgi:ATP-binding protein involved in chromosome partitioning
MTESLIPVDAKFNDGRLFLTWNDGHESVYHPVHLRWACNCAQCVDEITGERLIRREDIASDLKPKEMRPVGRYGVSFEWSDGHSTGIYTFARLRELCGCPKCHGTG